MKKYLLFIFIAFFVSCSDQIRDFAPLKNENKIQIEDARQLLATEKTRPRPAQSNTRLEQDRHSIVKNAVWEHAFHLNLSFGDALIVPTRFDEEIYYKPNQNVSLPISSLTYLMFYKDKKDEMHMEVVTSLPSFDKDDTTPAQSFKGTVYVENWQGDYLTGFIFKNGKTYKASSVQKKKHQGASEAPICHTVDWFTCVSVGGGTTSCTYDYSETICSPVGGGDSGGGGGSTGGDGGSGGGGGPTPDDYTQINEFIEVRERFGLSFFIKYVNPLSQVPTDHENFTDQDYLNEFINKINALANGGNRLLDDGQHENLFLRPVAFEISIGGLRYSGNIVDPSNWDPLARVYPNPSRLASDGSATPLTFTLDTGSTVKIWIYFQKTTIN